GPAKGIPGVRLRPAGAFQLSCRARAGAQQRRPAGAGRLTSAALKSGLVSHPRPVVRWLGRVDFEPTWRRMQEFTQQRDADTPDEIWLLEHPPVFTLGMNAAPEHVLAPGDIPVLQIDRGGQVTYHGPGQ